MSFIKEWILVFICFATAEFCQPPDVPVGGSCSPIQDTYLPGDRVEYSCNEGLMRIGAESMFCEVSGRWSASVPFCDAPIGTVNARLTVDRMDYTQDAKILIDGNTSTCYSFENTTYMRVHLYFTEEAVVTKLRLFLIKDYIEVIAMTVKGGRRRWCTTFNNYLDSDEWLTIECQDDQQADSMWIFLDSQQSNVVNVCEFEVFKKNDTEVPLKIPVTFSLLYDKLGDIRKVSDRNTDTCLTVGQSARRTINVDLSTAAILHGFRIFLKKGDVDIEVSARKNNWDTSCASITTYISEDRWVQMYCSSQVDTKTINFLDKSGRPNNLTVCEVEAFVKSDSACQSPPDIYLPNGHLEVSRSLASLRCSSGFKEGDNKRLVCEAKNNTWIGQSLKCNEILCDLSTGNLTGGEWRLEAEKPSIGSTRILECKEPDFAMKGELARAVCQQNSSWSYTDAICVSNKEPKGILNIAGIAAGAVCAFLLIMCTVITLYFICRPKKKDVVVAFLSRDYDSTIMKETDSIYEEIRDSNFYEKPKIDYYEIPKRY